jgi:Protein of unknown function (DUF3574)
LNSIYFLFLGRGVPNSNLTVSVNELKKFLVKQDLKGYSLFHGDGNYLGDEEENSLLIISGVSKEKAIDIITKYKHDYNQESVWLIESSANNSFI